MAISVEAFDAVVREFVKERWVKDKPSRWRHSQTGVRMSDSEYPAQLTRFVEVEIDGTPMRFVIRIERAK